MIMIFPILITVPVLIFWAPLIPYGQHGVTNLEIVCVKGLFSVHTYTLTHTQNTHSHTHTKTKKGTYTAIYTLCT